MAQMATRVEVVWRGKKTSTVCSARNMDAQLRNVSTRRGTNNNASTATRRVTKKRPAGIKKILTKNKKNQMAFNIYSTKSHF